MLSPKFSMCDSMNKPKISVKKSSTNARARRLDVTYCVGPVTMAIYACGEY